MEKRTAKHKILAALLEANNYPVYWYTKQVPRGYLTTGHLSKPDVGGSEATRRIREMQADGVDIDMMMFFANDMDGKRYHCYIYGLNTIADLIDFKTGTLKAETQAA